MGKKIKLTKEEILEWLSLGKTITELAIRIGVTKSGLCQYAKKMGIQLKNGRPKGIPMSEDQKEYRRNLDKRNGNAFSGKKHTKESKDKMKASHHDYSGNNNPYKKAIDSNEDKRIAASERRKLYWKNLPPEKLLEIKGNMSIAQSKNIQQNKLKNSKSGFYFSNKAGKIFYRSSWELIFAKILDGYENVDCFLLEPFCVDYLDSENIKKLTRIDFYIHFVNDVVAIIEIKPSELIDKLNNPQKIMGQMTYCKICGFEHRIVSDISEKNVIKVLDDIFYLKA
jgi:hypothetical protein